MIRHAVWLYLRFCLSLRDVEDLLAGRGLDLSYETVRRWVAQFGPLYARQLRRQRPRPYDRWHLHETFVSIGGRRIYVWRAVDSEGEVLDILVQPRRDKRSAAKLMRRLLKKQGLRTAAIMTDRPTSYGSALRDLGLARRHEAGGRINNRAETSHQPIRRRERSRIGFKQPGSTQRFLSAHAAVYDCFNVQRHLISRRTLWDSRGHAFQQWRRATMAS